MTPGAASDPRNVSRDPVRRTNLYVARERIKDGRPPVAIDTGKSQIDFAFEVRIDGPSFMRSDYRGLRGRKEITTWIETDAPVAVVR